VWLTENRGLVAAALAGAALAGAGAIASRTHS
jgi:hypothetical protein